MIELWHVTVLTTAKTHNSRAYVFFVFFNRIPISNFFVSKTPYLSQVEEVDNRYSMKIQNLMSDNTDLR